MKRITAALSAVALIGCGTPQKNPGVGEPPKNEDQQSGTGARPVDRVGGAAKGAFTCLTVVPAFGYGPGMIVGALAGLVCLPFGVVAGALIGGTGKAAQSTKKATQSTKPIPPPQAGPLFRAEGRFILVAAGQVQPGDALPPGDLHVAMETISLIDEKQKQASLVLNLEGAAAERGSSLVAQSTIKCATGAAMIHRSFVYGKSNGNGPLLAAEEHSPPVLIENASPAVASAIKTVCDLRPRWPNPVDLDAL